MKTALGLIVFAALTAATAVSGATFEPGVWYEGLSKPDWTPPNWAFPVAWTILYIMIAIAGWLAWRALGIGLAVAAWLIQMGLNALWSYLMFERHEITLALADIGILWVAIGAFVVLTWKPARLAALMFLPYWAWVTFAAALNYAVWVRNV